MILSVVHIYNKTYMESIPCSDGRSTNDSLLMLNGVIFSTAKNLFRLTISLYL